jgi:hypothetical protein
MKHILKMLIVFLLSLLTLGTPASAIAEELEGRLFLGDGLAINIAEKETLFQELLRYLNIKDSPRKLVNLSELGINGDNLFIGEDMKLYFNSEEKKGAAFCIGDARKLWQFKLDEDVDLTKVNELADLFSNENSDNTKLRVNTKAARERAIQVKQATFQFWLEELVYEYDSYSPNRNTDENYPYICNAIKSALPDSPEAPASSQDMLTHLAEYVKSTQGENLIPLRALVTEVIESLQKKQISETFIKKYKEIQLQIFKKTEGL